MSRPLMYDDQFKLLLKSDTKEKFFFCFPMKVQRSAFYKSLSLQNSIRICSIYDLLCAFFIYYCGSSSLFEIILIIFFILFGVISIHDSINLNKLYAKYYYHWRVFITIIIPIREFLSYNSKKICYYSQCMTFFYYAGLSLGVLIINIYAAKISWSFNIRLIKGEELLVIHGKILENMVNNENQKIIETQNEIRKNMEIELRKNEANIRQEMYGEDNNNNN